MACVNIKFKPNYVWVFVDYCGLLLPDDFRLRGWLVTASWS